jgi:hypothetical protein
MQRRDALRLLGTTALVPIISALTPDEAWAAGARLHERLARGRQGGRALDPAQLAELRALADTILPRTTTPGANDVAAPEFVDLLLAEWYSDRERESMLRGLDALTERCRVSYGQPIASVPADRRVAFVGSVDGKAGEAGTAEGSYARLKDALIFAFLTSEPIAPLASTLPVIPGRFDGCVPI